MPPQRFNLNSRTITAPLAAATMALLLFTYTRTSIRAAKQNAQKHREADGGQINWQNENLRRHGKLEVPEEQNAVKQLLGTAKDNLGMGKVDTSKGGITKAEEKVRERAGKSGSG